jgi:hypothetical protein
MPPTIYWLLGKSSFVANRIIPFKGPKLIMELGMPGDFSRLHLNEDG